MVKQTVVEKNNQTLPWRENFTSPTSSGSGHVGMMVDVPNLVPTCRKNPWRENFTSPASSGSGHVGAMVDVPNIVPT